MDAFTFRLLKTLAVTALLLNVTACSQTKTPPIANGPTGSPSQTAGAGEPNALAANSQSAGNQSNDSQKRKIDACALLASNEIQSVQGEVLKETKASGKSESGFKVSQCFFTLPTFNKSIALALTQKDDGSGGRDPRQYWKETFEGDTEAERDREKGTEKTSAKRGERGREEDEEKSARPEKIAGVGDEAFWTGSRVGGALYVLKDNSYIRLSIGGADDQQTRIKKSKALAQMVLKRL